MGSPALKLADTTNPGLAWEERLHLVRQELGVKPGAPEVRKLESYVQSIVDSRGKMIREGSLELYGKYPDLKPTPWMDAKKQVGYEALMDNYKTIREEALTYSASLTKYQDHPQADGSPGHDYKEWTSLDIINDFHDKKENWHKCPKTVEIVKQIPNTAGPLSTFSQLAPYFHLPWHSDGYMFVVSFHYAIVTAPECGFVVGGIAKHIPEGTMEVMNSAFQHTAWNYSPRPRIHLLVDFWHPDLNKGEKEALSLFFKDGTPARRVKKY